MRLSWPIFCSRRRAIVSCTDQALWSVAVDIWYNSLDGGSARHKTSAYTRLHNIERREHTSMRWAGFEPAIPVSKRSRPKS